MYLFELFGGDGESSLLDRLRIQVMDYLTPLAAKRVEYIPIQHVADILADYRSGLIIDRGLIMQIIDPNTCKLVSKVEGDKVYLTLPVDEISAKTVDAEQQDKEDIRKKAAAVAKKEIDK